MTETAPARIGVDVRSAAQHLLDELTAQPWGQVSASVYETGRVVTATPWLYGHAERVEFLLATQHRDGWWGGPDGYALVPTLSAVEALSTTLHRYREGAERIADPVRLSHAVGRGLRVLSGWLPALAASALPDTPAIELIVCALIDALNAHLHRHGSRPRLPVPAGLDRTPLDSLRRAVSAGAAVPDKLLHCLEALGELARTATVRPVPPGTIGASPAATAAWLGEGPPRHSDRVSVRYLETLSRYHRGPVPCATPVTTFERAWVLSGLCAAGVELEVPADVVTDLQASLGPDGTPGGPGLPTDADTTAVTLSALVHLGRAADPECLWRYETSTHFSTWPGESHPSTSVNAHVLDALGRCAPANRERHRAAIAKIVAWLCGQQRPDGSWRDRWHASPYYATASCVLALHRFGGAGARDALDRARRWVRTTQHPHGAWGHGDGTAEETAYAMQALLTGQRPDGYTARGYGYLVQHLDGRDDPPLWHDKDLYRPAAITRAAILAAVHLAQTVR